MNPRKRVKLQFGKYAQQDISSVPEEYLVWLLQSSKDTQRDVEEELARRERAEEASLSWIERVVNAGYRDLAKKHHPDVGGDINDMKALNAAFEALRGALSNSRG